MPAMPKLERIDINGIIEQLIDTYGSSFLLSIGGFIAFIFILFLTYKFLKSKGFFKTPLEVSLESVNNGMAQMNSFFVETTSSQEEYLKMIISNQEYKLSDEQVSILLKDKEFIYTQQLIDICVDIYVKNHIKENRERTLTKIKSSFKALIIKEDKEYFKLPSVNRFVLSTNEKIKIMEDHDIYTKLYDIMIEFNGSEGKTEDYIRNTKRFIENHVSTYWFK